MLEKECVDIATPVVENVVNQMAKNDYESLVDSVGNTTEDLADLKDWVNGFLQLNELSGIDAYGVACNFHPQYDYHQLSVYPYDDESGFSVDYDLTTDGERNDLTLQLEFKKQENGSFAVTMGVEVL